MGKKKRVRKELENQLQLAAVFDGVFDPQLISSVLKEAEGDHDIALLRLTEMRTLMFEESHRSNGIFSIKSDTLNSNAHDRDVDYIHSIFQTYERDVVSMMLTECNGDVDRVVEVISIEQEFVSACPCDVKSSSSSSNQISEQHAGSSAEAMQDDSIESPFQMIKYMLTDFMPADKIESYLEEKDCSESSTVAHLQSIMDDVLVCVSMSTTSLYIPDNDNDNNSNNNSDQTRQEGESLGVPIEITSTDDNFDIFLFESALGLELESHYLHHVGHDDSDAHDHTSDFSTAKNIVRLFFANNSPLCETRGSLVSDSMIDSALDLSRRLAMDMVFYDPDAAIGWICEELQATQENRRHSAATTAQKSAWSGGGRSKQSLMTYATKLSHLPPAPRPVACSFGGDSGTAFGRHRAAADAWEEGGGDSAPAPRITVDVSGGGGSRGHDRSQSAQQMASYWRSIHHDSKQNMLQCFSAASLTRSKNTVATGQRYKHDMFHAAAESSKFELLARNPHVLVGNRGGHFVEFLGFARSPQKGVSIDMHGVDVRSAVQFVKSLVEKCYRSGGDPVSVSLVVGVGNHSVRNIPKLRPAVMSYLKGSPMVKLQGCVEGRVDFTVGA